MAAYEAAVRAVEGEEGAEAMAMVPEEGGVMERAVVRVAA